MDSVTLDVKGMSCNHCVQAIEENVGKQKGVASVKVDLDQGKVDVRFDSRQVNREQIVAIIEEQGYDVVKQYTI